MDDCEDSDNFDLSSLSPYFDPSLGRYCFLMFSVVNFMNLIFSRSSASSRQYYGWIRNYLQDPDPELIILDPDLACMTKLI